MPLEDYGLIGDTRTAALVSRHGSIDWLCLPHFDSGACFAALVGESRHGCWLITPASPVPAVRRRYRAETLILETEFENADGAVRLIDFMTPWHGEPDLIRIVEGVREDMRMQMELIIRFDYGSIVPWVRNMEGHLRAIAGPDALSLWTTVPTYGKDLTTRADFVVREGERVSFLMMWHPSHTPSPEPFDTSVALDETERWWRQWCGRCAYKGPWREQVLRSLITLKALTYAPTGGIVAAPTTSLPEKIGGVRNWDYRYCWLRDATFTLYALMIGGLHRGGHRMARLAAARGRRRSVAAADHVRPGGRAPADRNSSCPGCRATRTRGRCASATPRVNQLQLDVYGEVMDALYLARTCRIAPDSRRLGAPAGAHRSSREGVATSPTRASGRSAGRGAISRIPRSWPGWPSIARSRRSSASAATVPSSAGDELRDEIHAEVCEKGFDPSAEHVHAVLRLRAISTRAC